MGGLSWALPSANFVTHGRMVTPSEPQFPHRTSWSVTPLQWGFILFSNLQLEILGFYSQLVSYSLWVKHWDEEQTVIPSLLFSCRTFWIYFSHRIVMLWITTKVPRSDDIINVIGKRCTKDIIHIHIYKGCIYSHHLAVRSKKITDINKILFKKFKRIMSDMNWKMQITIIIPKIICKKFVA